MEEEKNSFSAWWQGCALQLGHRAFILCSNNFITYFILSLQTLAYIQEKHFSLNYIVYVWRR